MRIPAFLALLAACTALAPSPAAAKLVKSPLETYDMAELTLLRVHLAKGDSAACFLAQHDRSDLRTWIWVRPHESVGNRFGEIDGIYKDHVAIRETQPVNHGDYIPILFSWPLAKSDDAKQRASGCGDKPPPPATK